MPRTNRIIKRYSLGLRQEDVDNLEILRARHITGPNASTMAVIRSVLAIAVGSMHYLDRTTKPVDQSSFGPIVDNLVGEKETGR